MSHWKRTRWVLVAAGLAIGLTGPAVAGIAGLNGPVEVVYDQFRVPTIIAQDEHDAIFMQGYLQAQDRFFQMDYQRHLFSGRVAELVGPGPGNSALAADVQLRTLGLRRAAERSMPVQTPEVLAWMQAYSDGVNAWLADPDNPLPLEYGFLELDKAGIEPWTPTDCMTMAKGLAFGLSFDLDDIDRTLALGNFLGVGDVLGFNGLQLFNSDLYRSAPFDPTLSIPGALAKSAGQAAVGECAATGSPQRPSLECDPTTGKADVDEELPEYMTDPVFFEVVQNYRERAAQVPLLNRALNRDYTQRGSNWWIAAGSLTESGYPMIMNDPHLALDAPSTFWEVHLLVEGGINVAGATFPGAPGVVLGCNETICWGATVNPLDVTDVYFEDLQALGPDPAVFTHSTFDGVPEPLQFIPQTFLVNGIGDGFNNTLGNAGIPADQGGVTLIVPRRNNGPIVGFAAGRALSVAYTGWSATQELETFRRFARAENMTQFKEALQYFDVGSQNWAYADVNGNIAYYTSAEIPIREDLQFLFAPDGLVPPYLIRDGAHNDMHEWVPLTNPQPQQALGWEILPFDEMPQIENPASGYILNANNDPIGTSLDNLSWNEFRAGFNGRLYLSPGYATGYRMGRIQRLWDAKLGTGNPFTLTDFIGFQGNNQLLDAEVLSPYLLDAFANATAPGADAVLAALAGDPRVAEAIGRIADWDFSTPTGIIEGFDPGDNPLAPMPPSQAEIDASVAASIYAVWRGQVVQRVIDGTLASLPVPLDAFAPGSAQAMSALRNLLDRYETTGGTGASLINFFTVPGVVDQDVARDLILLGALQSGLDLLASDTFAPAFGNSTNQEDYRWGKLHRITFDSALDPALSIPPTGVLGPDLPGIPRAGGMGAVDASSHSARADGLNEFSFGSGPARRFIGVMAPGCPEALEVLPGGESGNPLSPQATDQLGLWLVNAYKPLAICRDQVDATAVETVYFPTPVCGNGVVEGGEECDDGNLIPGDLCDEFCQEEELLVELEYFNAAPAKGGVMLRWATAVELDTVGFRVLRGTGGREKALELVSDLIPAKGTNLVGAEYTFIDTTAPEGTLVYYLEDVDSFGRTQRHGPVTIERLRDRRTTRR